MRDIFMLVIAAALLVIMAYAVGYEDGWRKGWGDRHQLVWDEAWSRREVP